MSLAPVVSTATGVTVSATTFVDQNDAVLVESCNKTDLLWAAIEGQDSVGGFCSISLPANKPCFVVVMAACKRKASFGTIRYYAHMGSLFLKPNKAVPRTTLPVYRPVKDDYIGETGLVASTTLSGTFTELEHPAAALRQQSDAHVQRVSEHMAKVGIAPHGLITVRGLLNFHGTSPLSAIAFNTVRYEKAELQKDWEVAVGVAIWMLHCTASPDEYPPKLWRCVATLALTLLSGPYPLSETGENRVHLPKSGWTRSSDSRNHPAFGLFSNKDCDGKAWAICETFYLLRDFYSATKPDAPTHGAQAASALLTEFSDAYMVSLMVDSAKVDGTKHSKPSGHCFAMLTTAPGTFANGTFVASCNMIHNFWPPSTVSLRALFPDLEFLEPQGDVGGYFYAKPSDLSLYQKVVFFIGRDGAYAVSGASLGKGRAWNAAELGYTGEVTNCELDPYSITSVLMGASKVERLPSPADDPPPFPPFRLRASDVKFLRQQAYPAAIADDYRTLLPTVHAGSGKCVTLSGPMESDPMLLLIGMAAYAVLNVKVAFDAPEIPTTARKHPELTFRDLAGHSA